MAEQSFLDFYQEAGILRITINNPPHNHLLSAVFRDFLGARPLMSDPQVKAVVFTGIGTVFSKGADVAEIRAGIPGGDREALRLGNESLNFIANLRKPVVAAINGVCLGGGLELALACHLRICTEKSFLGLPELTAGLIPGLGGLQRLIQVVGESKALEMVLLGDMIPAAKALELGLVNRVYPKADFLSRVMLLVKTILAAKEETIRAVLDLAVRSRPSNEGENIAEAAERFVDLLPPRV